MGHVLDGYASRCNRIKRFNVFREDFIIVQRRARLKLQGKNACCILAKACSIYFLNASVFKSAKRKFTSWKVCT